MAGTLHVNKAMNSILYANPILTKVSKEVKKGPCVTVYTRLCISLSCYGKSAPRGRFRWSLCVSVISLDPTYS